MLNGFKLTLFSEIFNAPLSQSSKFNNSVIIGFDLDWASDFVLEDSLNLAKEYGVNPALFVTHESPFIKKIFKEEKNEFGLHPNFERLLEGCDANGENSELVLERLTNKFPNLKLVRSHSLTTSSRLKMLFKKHGLLIESSFITHGSNVDFPKFWIDYFGLTQVPITWEDDLWFTSKKYYDNPITSEILRLDTINVLTFHPIHIYLNTINNNHYLKAKDFQHDEGVLINHRTEGRHGIRSIFKDVCRLING
jgi:hypothetical protein